LDTLNVGPRLGEREREIHGSPPFPWIPGALTVLD